MGLTHSPAARGLGLWPASGWRHLPRDARDTLFLLGVTLWTVAPHAGHLPAWCSAGVLGLLAWRWRLALSGAALPGRWTLISLLAAGAALTWWKEGTLLGKEPGVTLLVVLMALKTLEMRARRDAMVLFFLGFFLVLTHFLYSQSLLIALAMVGAVWGLLTALVLAHMPAGRPPLWRAAAVAGRAALLGAPIMVALFVLFPRVGPLWGLPNDAVGRTGLSGTLRMGGVAELANDESIALRVRFDGPPPLGQALYFRGPVLSWFDGREWTREPLRSAGRGPWVRPLPDDLQTQGSALRYEMMVEPSRLAMVPLLEATSGPVQTVPPDALPGLARRSDLQWQTAVAVNSVFSLKAEAWPTFRHGQQAGPVALRGLVDLPAGYNPRTLEWAAALRRDPRWAQADARTLSDAVLAHIRTGDYGYTMEPGPYGRDAVDEFWLDRKIGFCEHFATAYVVVMRALDVPARVVTGYQGTDPVPVDGWWIVRNSHAHAWAEIWQPGEGWVRVDPTAAVAPERVLRSLALRPAPGFVVQALNAVNPTLWADLRRGWERAQQQWNQWVVGYSRKQQFDLMKRLGVEFPDTVTLSKVLIGLLCAGALAGAAWAAWDRRRQDPWQRLHRHLHQRLARLGVDTAAHEGPRARAAAARAALGDAAAPLQEVLLALELDRYGPGGHGTSPREWRRRIDQALQGLKPVAHRAAPAGSACATAAVLSALALVLALMGAAGFSPGALAASTAQADSAKPKPARKKSAQKKAPAGPADGSEAYGRSPAVQAFAEEMAQRHGLSPEWIERQLAGARRLPSVQRLIMPPPIGTPKNWAVYRDRFVEPQRIEAGLRFWQAHRRWFDEAESRWGVPASIVAAVIGVETFYGRHTGSFRAIDALATLAFDFPPGRRDRSALFRDELGELLALARREGRDPASFKGSYAGALGLPQFLPSSISRWAVDFDGDGHIDLLANPADAIGSVAHYLAAFGWESGLPTHHPVEPPDQPQDRAHLLGPDIVPSFTAAQMSERGARLSAPGHPEDALLALVELENGDGPRSYVAGTRNFWVVTRYNWSSYYAMAVIDLADALRRARGNATR